MDQNRSAATASLQSTGIFNGIFNALLLVVYVFISLLSHELSYIV